MNNESLTLTELSNANSIGLLNPNVSVLRAVDSDAFLVRFLESFWALGLLHTVLSVPLESGVTLVSDTRILLHSVVWWA